VFNAARGSESSPPGFALFDSGMGGLSVLRHFLDLFPGEDFLYLGDMARFPYGSKSREMIRKFALEDAGFLMEFRPRTLVAACFTVSSQALDDLVAHFAPVRVVGMVEAGAVAALSATRTGRIGVLGTEGTIQSGAYPALLRRLSGKDTDVLSVACPLFAPMVEEGWIDGDIPERVVREYLSPFLTPGSRVDTLILGCTHYPPLLPLLRKILPEVVFIDPGKELALAERSPGEGGTLGGAGQVTYLVTDGRKRFQSVGQRLLGQPIPEVHEVVIPVGEYIFTEGTGRT
jgi:glutamate racemase